MVGEVVGDIAHAGHDILIKDALVFLLAAGLVVPILRSLKLPAVAGFILAGIALGPSGIAVFSDSVPWLEYVTISEPSAAQPFAELGVLTLLFLLGLDLSFPKLWAWRRTVFGTGLMQVLLSACVIGLTCYVVLKLGAMTSALLGMALGLSSTAIVMQLLTQGGQMGKPIGRTGLSVLLMQDIMVAPILIFVGFAGRDVGADLPAVMVEALLEGLAAVAIIYLVGRFLLRRVFHLAVAAGGRDFLLAITLLTVVGAAILSAQAGLSLALGAFLAGLMLGETEFKHQTEVDLEPFKGLLLGLFFVTVGLGVDLGVVAAQWPLILAGLAVMLALKALVVFVSVWVFSRNAALSLEAAFLLAPAGEFAFVILAASAATGVIAPEVGSIVVAIVGLSMLLTPGLWAIGRAFSGRLVSPQKEDAGPTDYSALDGHMIVAGFGRVGRTIADLLEREGCRLIALDTKADRVKRERAAGRDIYLGDASREEVLKAVGIDRAHMVLVTLDHPAHATRIVQIARRLNPAAQILVRASDPEHAADLYDVGASFVVPDAIEAGLQISARALEEIGLEAQAARDQIRAVREDAYRIRTAPAPDAP